MCLHLFPALSPLLIRCRTAAAAPAPALPRLSTLPLHTRPVCRAGLNETQSNLAQLDKDEQSECGAAARVQARMAGSLAPTPDAPRALPFPAHRRARQQHECRCIAEAGAGRGRRGGAAAASAGWAGAADVGGVPAALAPAGALATLLDSPGLQLVTELFRRTGPAKVKDAAAHISALLAAGAC